MRIHARTMAVGVSALLLVASISTMGQTQNAPGKDAPRPPEGQGEAAPSQHDDMPPPPPPPGGRLGEGPGFDFMRRSVEMDFSEDERSNLRRLAFEKPDEFHAELKKRFQSVRQKRAEEFKRMEELQKAYRDAATVDAKLKAHEDIKKFVKEQFDQKMELNKKRMEETEANLKDAQKKLEDFKRKYEERKIKADEIIAERVKELTKDPSLNW